MCWLIMKTISSLSHRVIYSVMPNVQTEQIIKSRKWAHARYGLDFVTLMPKPDWLHLHQMLSACDDIFFFSFPIPLFPPPFLPFIIKFVYFISNLINNQFIYIWAKQIDFFLLVLVSVLDFSTYWSLIHWCVFWFWFYS